LRLILHHPHGKRNDHAIAEVDRVSHAYGKHAVVSDLSFDPWRPGEIACLLGSSGCGKTTMLRLIAGFEAPSNAGSIRLNGVTIADGKVQIPAEADASAWCSRTMPCSRI
jgi:iron(III) transport system ATP-binding protein